MASKRKSGNLNVLIRNFLCDTYIANYTIRSAIWFEVTIRSAAVQISGSLFLRQPE